MRKSSRSNNGESSCPPGPLPGGTPESHYFLPACCRGEHHYLLSVCQTFRLNYSLEFGSFSTDFIFPQAAQFMFPFVFGKFIYRQTFDCLCERYLAMIPCMLYGGDFQYDPVHAVWWGFSTELLRESTVHKLNFVHESSRFSCVHGIRIASVNFYDGYL